MLGGAALLLAVSAAVLAEGDAAAGKQKTAMCQGCHGENGVSQAPDFPKLAGQHQDYLVRTLNDYKSGARKNAIMAGQVANLKREDIADLAAYYSGQRALTTKY